MPQFYKNLPKTQSDIRNSRLDKTTLPVGVISENFNYSWGYDGEKYYVTEGLLKFFVTKIHLAFDEAKQLFEALNFTQDSEPSQAEIKALIKSARKEKLYGSALFWHFEKGLTTNKNR